MELSGLYYPNRLARVFLLAMQEVLGKNALNAVLGLADLPHLVDEPVPNTLAKAFDFAHLAALTTALETMYGGRGGRGMALRVGRASFALGIRDFGAMAGMNDPAFRALPLDSRAQLGLQALAFIFNHFSDQRCHVLDKDDVYVFLVEISPFAWNRVEDRPVCHALVGIIQETLRWSSNGYEYHVHETTCRATGDDYCTFHIARKPIGQL